PHHPRSADYFCPFYALLPALISPSSFFPPPPPPEVYTLSLHDALPIYGHGGERIGPLEHHAHLTAHLDRVDVRPVQVLTVHHRLTLHASAGEHLVHPVQRAQERGLPAAGRPDQGRDAARLDRHGDAFDGAEVTVVDVQVVGVDSFAHVVFLVLIESPWGGSSG